MKFLKLAAVLSVLAITYWVNVPNALAACLDDSACIAPKVCIDARCVYPTDCIPPGGIDDVLYNTNCCSGAAVPGSTSCANPADYGTTWASCTQICA